MRSWSIKAGFNCSSVWVYNGAYCSTCLMHKWPSNYNAMIEWYLWETDGWTDRWLDERRDRRMDWKTKNATFITDILVKRFGKNHPSQLWQFSGQRSCFHTVSTFLVLPLRVINWEQGQVHAVYCLRTLFMRTSASDMVKK